MPHKIEQNHFESENHYLNSFKDNLDSISKKIYEFSKAIFYYIKAFFITLLNEGLKNFEESFKKNYLKIADKKIISSSLDTSRKKIQILNFSFFINEKKLKKIAAYTCLSIGILAIGLIFFKYYKIINISKNNTSITPANPKFQAVEKSVSTNMMDNFSNHFDFFKNISINPFQISFPKMNLDTTNHSNFSIPILKKNKTFLQNKICLKSDYLKVLKNNSLHCYKTNLKSYSIDRSSIGNHFFYLFHYFDMFTSRNIFIDSFAVRLLKKMPSFIGKTISKTLYVIPGYFGLISAYAFIKTICYCKEKYIKSFSVFKIALITYFFFLLSLSQVVKFNIAYGK